MGSAEQRRLMHRQTCCDSRALLTPGASEGGSSFEGFGVFCKHHYVFNLSTAFFKKDHFHTSQHKTTGSSSILCKGGDFAAVFLAASAA